MIRKYFRKLLYRKVVLEGSGCTNHLLKNRITFAVMLHRADGPAIIREDGTQTWFLKGKMHRADGPAFINPNGAHSWYLNGKMYTFNEYVTQLFPEDSPERTAFLLKWMNG
jgi:hypothetical protein